MIEKRSMGRPRAEVATKKPWMELRLTKAAMTRRTWIGLHP
jgi:hypothetical protein